MEVLDFGGRLGYGWSKVLGLGEIILNFYILWVWESYKEVVSFSFFFWNEDNNEKSL